MSQSGERQYRVDVLEHTGTAREGERTYHRDEDWKTILPNLPVSYKGVSGGETVRGRQMEPGSTGLLETAWSPKTAAITKQMRLKMGERILNIVNVMDMEGRRRVITIQVEEKR